jgi:ATP-binding cassette, subfamily B, bacterial
MKSNKRLHQTPQAPYFHKPAWKYYYGFLKDDKYKLIATSVGFIALAYFIVPTLWLVKYVFDVAIPQKQITAFFWVGGAILALRLINSGITIYLRTSNIKTISKSIFNLRDDLISRVFNFSRNFYTREDLGVLHAQIVQDTERITRMSNNIIAGLFPSIFLTIGLIVILIWLNWQLFLIILLFFPIIYFSNQYMGKILKQRVFDFQRSFEHFSKGTLFLMKFMDLIKTQSVEEEERDRHTATLADLREKTTRRTYFGALNSQLQGLLIGLIGILVMVVGGIAVVRETMTLGDLMAFYMAANQLQQKLNNLSGSFTTLLTGNESLVTLYNIANRHESEPYQGTEKVDFFGNIRFRSVSFKYDKTPVLNHIDLEIHPHESIAIIGENGSGKSTIINLLLGFYKPQSGSIYAGGVDYDVIDFRHLRKQIGVVSQHPPLIPGTIMENIYYGNSDCSETEMMEAARLSLADKFIQNLPDGYRTQIGENGVLLSGGERQKVAIARALLRNPGLLILDEPTNHLDITAVKEIMQNIKQLKSNPAILIISHDMEVIRNAEKIYVIKNGLLELLEIKPR